jgi:hypothetical protein
MKHRLSVLLLGFVGLCLTPSCGDDEGTDGGGDGGDDSNSTCSNDEDCTGTRVCIDNLRGDMDGFCEPGEVCSCAAVVGQGGSSGSGTGGRGGSSGATVTGGTGGNVTSLLGDPCTTNAQCGTGLMCLLPDGLPSGDGPPNGLCTLQCATGDDCLEFANEAYCVGFEEDAAGNALNYCILGCVGGAVGAPKCRVRDDFACGILGTEATTQGCVDTNDCAAQQVCFAEIEGNPTVCHDMTTACIPVCRADEDCANGQFCDFSSGFCTAAEPTGLAIGELCDPTLPAEQDPCNGFCIATDATETEGTCAAFCSASQQATGCGWTGDPADSPEAGCLYATIISREGAGGISLAESDLMLCGQLCDCNDDCPAEVEFCMDENSEDTMASINAIFGRPGYCRPLLTGETEADSIMCAQAGR